MFPVFITKMCYTYGNDANHDWRTHADSLVILQGKTAEQTYTI